MAASSLRQVRLDVAYLGVDVDDAPAATPRAKGRHVENYLTGDSGRLRQRGAITHAGLAYASLPVGARPAGYMRGPTSALLSFGDHKQADRIIEPHVAPYKPSLSPTLAVAAIAANSEQYVDLSGTPSVTGVTPTSRQLVPGPRRTRYGQFEYAIGYDSINDDTAGVGDGIAQVDGVKTERLTWILMRDSSLGAGTQPTQALKGYHPYGAQDLRIHYGRLLVLGGTDPGGPAGGVADPATIPPSRVIRHDKLYFTQALGEYDRGGSLPLNLTDFSAGINSLQHGANAAYSWRSIWLDETSGILNSLTLPSDGADFGVAMASAGRHLAILQRRSLILLTGYGSESYTLRTFSQNIGCLDPRSVIEANDGCYFLSAQGFMFFDGVQIHDASKGIHRSLLTAGLNAVGDEATAGGFAISERLTNDFLMLTIGSAGFAASAPTPTVTFCGLYHIPTDSWSLFSSASFAATGSAPTWLGRTDLHQWAADHTKLFPTRNITTPENVAEADRGHDEAGATDNNIVTKWHSRTVELAAPYSVAVLHRVMIDYEWIVDGDDAVPPLTGPTVTVLDGNGTVLVTPYTLPSGPADPAPGISRARHVQDIFEEANDVWVKIEYTSTVTTLVQSSILDVFIEYQVGQEKH